MVGSTRTVDHVSMNGEGEPVAVIYASAGAPLDPPRVVTGDGADAAHRVYSVMQSRNNTLIGDPKWKAYFKGRCSTVPQLANATGLDNVDVIDALFRLEDANMIEEAGPFQVAELVYDEHGRFLREARSYRRPRSQMWRILSGNQK